MNGSSTMAVSRNGKWQAPDVISIGPRRYTHRLLLDGGGNFIVSILCVAEPA